jgi:hypothetical protein
MGRRKKPRMRDLTVSPEENFNIQYEVQKRQEKLRKKMLVDIAYNKRFSMLHNGWKRATIFLVGGIGLTFLIMWFINIILTSAGYPSAIPF